MADGAECKFLEYPILEHRQACMDKMTNSFKAVESELDHMFGESIEWGGEDGPDLKKVVGLKKIHRVVGCGRSFRALEVVTIYEGMAHGNSSEGDSKGQSSPKPIYMLHFSVYTTRPDDLRPGGVEYHSFFNGEERAHLSGHSAIMARHSRTIEMGDPTNADSFFYHVFLHIRRENTTYLPHAVALRDPVFKAAVLDMCMMEETELPRAAWPLLCFERESETKVSCRVLFVGHFVNDAPMSKRLEEIGDEVSRDPVREEKWERLKDAFLKGTN